MTDLLGLNVRTQSNVNPALRKTTDQYFDTINRLIQWRNAICQCLTSSCTLQTSQLVDLASFLSHIAVWIQRLVEANIELCVFCRNNNESYEVYTSHKVKDRSGRVTCPILRQFKCPMCDATGDRAHTIRYCPRLISNGLSGSSSGNRGPSVQLMQAGLLQPTHFN